MSSDKQSGRRGTPALLISLALAGLAMLCVWGAWLALRPDLDTFLLQEAHDIHYERVGPGMQGLLFSYNGSVEAQTARLFAAVERRGWRAGLTPSREDCEGRCILGQVTLIFVRQSLFNLVQEVASVQQRGIGPYHVRVVLRRCVQLPRMSCWPPA